MDVRFRAGDLAWVKFFVDDVEEIARIYAVDACYHVVSLRSSFLSTTIPVPREDEDDNTRMRRMVPSFVGPVVCDAR